MNTLSCFICSSKVEFFLPSQEKEAYLKFPFYPTFQSEEDLETLISKVLEISGLEKDTIVFPISSFQKFTVFRRESLTLNDIFIHNSSYGYFYLDNFNLISSHNSSLCSLHFTNRMDNVLSNRSIYPCNVYNNDLEEVAFFSKSITTTYQSPYSQIIFAGDYLGNLNINSEYKMNLITNLLKSGFYEVLIDFKNQFPHFMNLKMNTALSLKNPSFSKFFYLISTDQDLELLIENGSNSKLLNTKNNDFYFLHSDYKSKLKLKFKNRQIGKGEVEVDPEFGGILIDARSEKTKKEDAGIDGFKKLQIALEKNYDYSNF